MENEWFLVKNPAKTPPKINAEKVMKKKLNFHEKWMKNQPKHGAILMKSRCDFRPCESLFFAKSPC